MTPAVEELLRIFDALSESERRDAVAEILQRITRAEGDLPEGALLEVADALFCTLDSEEASNAGS